MGWQTLLTLVIIIPVLLIPAVLFWRFKSNGVKKAMKESRSPKKLVEKPQENNRW